MLCRTFFIDLNHVMVLKLVNVLVCDMFGDAISCLEAVIELMKPFRAGVSYTVRHVAK